MIVNTGLMDQSIFEFQLEMVDMNSKITLETAMLEYGVISESENIFVKIKNGILKIIRRIKDFITNKLFGKHKSISNNIDTMLDNSRKQLQQVINAVDSIKLEYIDPKGPAIEGFEGQTIYIIDGGKLEEMYTNGVDDYLNKELKVINGYLRNFSNPANFKDKEPLQNYCKEFKDKGVKNWFSDPHQLNFKNTNEVNESLKRMFEEDSMTCSFLLIKDGKLQLSIEDFKEYVDWLDKNQKKLIDENKKTIEKLNKFITTFDNDVKRVNIDPDKYKDLVSLFSQFCNTVTSKNAIQLAIVNGVMNLQIKRMKLVSQISSKLAAMTKKEPKENK